jgi:glutamate N-acetyltransferase/amino-acid N-acetyltransferase
MSQSDSSSSESMMDIRGCRLNAVAAGVRYENRSDIALIELSEGSVVVGAFTQNAFCAAPVVICKNHLGTNQARYLLINSGNANAGTGQAGFDIAMETCALVAKATGVESDQVLPFSTGVIGELLPLEPFQQSISELVSGLSANFWPEVARAIMTTDTRPKLVQKEFELSGSVIKLSGIAKGAGMIHPNMATMLAYIVSDIAITEEVAQQWHLELCEKTFNRATVDGDTSTNDSCILACTGKAGNLLIDNSDSEDALIVKAQIFEIYRELAQAIVRDGEGATKFVTIEVSGGNSEDECKKVGFSVAHSPLVKTALFACDPNWGRILAAVGNADIDNLNIDAIEIALDQVPLVERGAVHSEYSEVLGQEIFDKPEFTIYINLNRGGCTEEIWTTDLSHDYVRINAEYRT